MYSRTPLALAVLSTVLLTTFTAAPAEAQLRDRPRIRVGAALEGGGLFAPGVVDLGFIGVQGQLGVQLNNTFGLYAAPNIDYVSGRFERGVQVGGALLADFTLFHVLTVGIGPEAAGFVARGRGETSAGLLYGARLHLAVNPFVEVNRRGGRRQALTIGLDLRLVTGGGAGVLSARRVAAEELVAGPTLTIGYQAF